MPQDGFSMPQMPYGPWMSPQNLDPAMASAMARQNYAQALLGEGTQTSPVRSPWQAVARAFQGAMGGVESGLAQQGMQDYATGQRKALGDIYSQMLIPRPQDVIGNQGAPQQGGGSTQQGGGYTQQPVQQQPLGPPPGSNIQPGQPLSAKDAKLSQVSWRESGGQNIFSQIPGAPVESRGSGYYQIIPSTWKEGLQLAGIQGGPDLAINASPQMQYQVASALYDKYGDQPWAASRPGAGAGAGGSFVGASSSQPAAPGGINPEGAALGQTPQQRMAAYGGQMGRYYQGLAAQAAQSPYAAVRAMAPQLMQQALGAAQYGRYQEVGISPNGQPQMLDTQTGQMSVVGEPVQLHEGPFGQVTANNQLVIPNAQAVARGLAPMVGKGNADVDNAYNQVYGQAWPAQREADPTTGALTTLANPNAPRDIPAPAGYPAVPGYAGGGGGAAVPGAGAGAQAPVSNVRLATTLGVPAQAPEASPYIGMPPLEAQKQRAADRSTANEQLAESDKEAQAIGQNLVNLERYKVLNSRVQTGSDFPTRGTLAYQEHWASNPDLQQMHEIEATTIPEMKVGSGISRVTNKDMGVFEGMTVSDRNSPQANAQIIDGLRMRGQQALEYNRFQHDYVSVNGNLQGVQNAWDRYTAANPLFNVDDKGNYTPNTNRQDYRTYFRSNMDPQTGQLREAGQQAQPATAQPATITTQGNQMPPAAQYEGRRIQGPDGTVWQANQGVWNAISGPGAPGPVR